MAYTPWLADVARAAGLRVVEVEGWERRSTWTSGYVPQGVIVHHTGPWSLPGIISVLRDGRKGANPLAGPLAQIGVGPDGTVYIVAAGRANHNGFGRWGNDAIGIEPFNSGSEPWTPAMYDAVARLVAAILKHQRWGTDRVLGHKESDPDRKWDPTIDMDDFRATVRGIMAGPTTEEDELMAAKDEILAAIKAESEARARQVQGVHDSLVKRLGVGAREAEAGEDLQSLVKKLLPGDDA